MKTRIFFVLVLISTIFTGCKNDKSVDDLNVVKSEVPDVFKVTVRVICEKNDDFSLYYSEDGSLNFPVVPLWMPVQGNPSEQDVTFSLPEQVIPTQLRLDFGMNKEQGDIILKSIKLDYKGKIRSFVGGEMGNFFRADHTKCSFDPVTGVIKAVVKDGVRQYPSLYPHETILGPELENFVQ